MVGRRTGRVCCPHWISISFADTTKGFAKQTRPTLATKDQSSSGSVHNAHPSKKDDILPLLLLLLKIQSNAVRGLPTHARVAATTGQTTVFQSHHPKPDSNAMTDDADKSSISRGSVANQSQIRPRIACAKRIKKTRHSNPIDCPDFLKKPRGIMLFQDPTPHSYPETGPSPTAAPVCSRCLSDTSAHPTTDI